MFEPTKEFFIGIDSDGTAFDSMNIKHIKSMHPAAVEIWDFGLKREVFETSWNRINLYSKTRGINRFLGLLDAFEELGEDSPVPDISPFKEYIKNNKVFSNTTLQEWVEKHPHPFLDDIMRWSKRSDELFNEYTQGLLPFVNVEPCLAAMAEKAEIVAISSASSKGLVKDWTFSGLRKYTAMIAGQETGSKEVQLQMCASEKYPCEKILMVGDAPGDLGAALFVNALFFPVMPGGEEASWQQLKDEALPKFFAGTFKGKYENALIEKFLKLLG
jgi:phosphoglycolate phosphatase-like HAD superfamily hydrolase